MRRASYHARPSRQVKSEAVYATKSRLAHGKNQEYETVEIGQTLRGY